MVGYADSGKFREAPTRHFETPGDAVPPHRWSTGGGIGSTVPLSATLYGASASRPQPREWLGVGTVMPVPSPIPSAHCNIPQLRLFVDPAPTVPGGGEDAVRGRRGTEPGDTGFFVVPDLLSTASVSRPPGSWRRPGGLGAGPRATPLDVLARTAELDPPHRADPAAHPARAAPARARGGGRGRGRGGRGGPRAPAGTSAPPPARVEADERRRRRLERNRATARASRERQRAHLEELREQRDGLSREVEELRGHLLARGRALVELRARLGLPQSL